MYLRWYLLHQVSMSKKKDKEKKPSKWLQTYKLIRNTILGIIIAILAVFIVLVMITRISGGTPTVFGYSMFRVSSGSMQPALEVGDVIITKEFDPMTVKKEDIVTYKSESGSMSGRLVTHRVIRGPYKNKGKFYIITKGDANTSEDDPVRLDQIESKYLFKVSVLKFIYNIFVTPAGLLIVIGLVIFAFFNEIVIFFKAITGMGYEEEPEESVEDIIERYQKENKKLQKSEDNPDDESKPGG